MFFKRKTAVAENIETKVRSSGRPKPSLHLVKTNSDQISSYIKLSKEMNFRPVQLTIMLILEILYKENITVYNYDEVDKYLRMKIKEDSIDGHWVWKPLRSKDYNLKLSWPSKEGYDHYHGVYYEGIGMYQKLVPYEILETVKKIESKMVSSEIHNIGFYVSDYHIPKPDPFIALMGAGFDRPIIFGEWDEPDFYKNKDQL